MNPNFTVEAGIIWMVERFLQTKSEANKISQQSLLTIWMTQLNRLEGNDMMNALIKALGNNEDDALLRQTYCLTSRVYPQDFTTDRAYCGLRNSIQQLVVEPEVGPPPVAGVVDVMAFIANACYPQQLDEQDRRRRLLMETAPVGVETRRLT